MRFDCPKCHQGIEVEARFIGKSANCPYCLEDLIVPMVSGGPPRVALAVADDDEEPSPKWTDLPQKASASVANALRILCRRA